jgi:hypothetical protein
LQALHALCIVICDEIEYGEAGRSGFIAAIFAAVL